MKLILKDNSLGIATIELDGQPVTVNEKAEFEVAETAKITLLSVDILPSITESDETRIKLEKFNSSVGTMSLNVICEYEISDITDDAEINIETDVYEIEGYSTRGRFGYKYLKLTSKNAKCKIISCQGVNEEDVLKVQREYNIFTIIVDLICEIIPISFLRLTKKKIKHLSKPETIIKYLGYGQ